MFIPLLKPLALSQLTIIFFKLATDVSNQYIPSYKVVIEKDDLLVVPYGLPHEVMCFDNVISEHINYRGLDEPEKYSSNSPLLYKQDLLVNKITRNYIPNVAFTPLKI